jgi:hypothetical protein
MLNLETSKHTFNRVKRQARNRWSEILAYAGVDAKALRDVHGPCPGCKGKDRFRFDNKDGDGTFICSQGNGDTLSGDGFELLQHAGIVDSPKEALDLVAKALDTGGIRRRAAKIEYVYRQPDGTTNLKVIRQESSDGTKTFKQLLPNSKPPKSDPAFTPFPYRIDEWPLNQPIIICEGEKCADALWQVGFSATTRAGGSSTWEPELNQHFIGRDVIILPDNDDAGRSFATKVGRSLSLVASTVHVCELPNLPIKGDVVDWIDSGGQAAELQRLMSVALPFDAWTQNARQPKGPRSIRALKAKKIEVRDQLHEFLPPGFTLLSGAPKVGKSKLAEFVSRQVAETHDVLFLALEYNELVAQLRFGHMGEHLRLKLYLEGELPQWDDGGESLLEDALRQTKPSLTVIDVIGRIKKRGEAKGYEGETESLSAIKQMMSRHNCDCLAIHHLRKAGLSDNPEDPFERILGSTALAAVPDNLQVMLPSDKDVVLHTKGRVILPSKRLLRLNGHDFEEIHSALMDLPSRATAQKEIIHLIAGSGEISVGEIADRLNKQQPQISMACQRLTELGKITRLHNGNYALSDTNLF